VEAVFEGPRAGAVPLEPEPGGYFSGLAEGRGAGDRYRLRLDGGDLLPDPASRFQPEGPHGPSEVVDPGSFPWRVHGWKGLTMKGLAVYELHVGTFSREGSWAGAARRLPELADLGVTAVEVMPVAEVPGRFNWGYDGVDLYAPTRNYGRPDDFRAFVDRAHELGLGVLLDVVYNHLGPDGNYLKRFAPAYFSARVTEWGEALNYDGPDCGPVRDFMTANAAYWISEYRLDGLRFDATQCIFDGSEESIFSAFSRAARRAAGARSIVLFSESETQEARFVAPRERGGYGFDGLWNDDYHHALRVALTGRREAYYQDYRGSAAELATCVKKGYLYQGQHYSWQGKRRGTPTHGAPPEAFVAYLENHDQVANSTPQGRRLVEECAAGPLRAATALLLLGPATPLLFQGQEDGSGVPFVFFADHNPQLAALVSKGRRDFMAQFPCMAGDAARAAVPDPSDRAAFERCLAETGRDDAKSRAWRALHKDLLALRREDRVLSAPAPGSVDAAALGPRALCLRWFSPDAADRLLTVNLGDDLPLDCLSEPLLASPPGMRWEDLWASEDPRYGGDGTPPFDERRWRLAAGVARLLRAVPEEAPRGAA
jgi:maltooligosyltrehalose trehalohydrolase